MAVDDPFGTRVAAQDTGILRYPLVIIWLLSGVKQTKEATEAAWVSSGPTEDKIGTADALRPRHPLHYARIRGWSRDGRTPEDIMLQPRDPVCRRK